jgi:hypothetical protein
VVTGIAYLATDRWPLVSASITGFMFACLLPNIIAPEWAADRQRLRQQRLG